MTTAAILIIWFFYPPAAVFCLILSWNSKSTRRWLLWVSLFIAAVIIVLAVSGISTRWALLNLLLLAFPYFIVWFILGSIVYFERGWVKAAGKIAAVLLFIATPVFTLGEGLFMNSATMIPVKKIRINNRIIYREYNLGLVTANWRGVEVTLSKSYGFVLQTEIYSKTYLNSPHGFKTKIIGNPKINNSTKYFFNLNSQIGYNAATQDILLQSDDSPSLMDTLHLKGNY